MTTMALLALVAAASGFLVYWRVLFSRVLPLERRLSRLRGHADDVKVFSLEILDASSAGKAPSSVAEIGHRAVAALHRLEPELRLWWICRQEDGQGALVAQQGGSWAAQDAESLSFERGAFKAAVPNGAVRSLPGGLAAGDVFLKSLADHGVRKARLVPWGPQGGPSGLLVVGDSDPEGRRLARLDPFLDIVRPMATSMATIAARLAELAQARESLQGGLSATIESLTDTHTRLIQKSRQIRTLHDVATTLTSHMAQAQSTLGAIVAIVARFLQADLVAFLLLDESTGELVTQPGAFGLESEDLFYRVALTESESSSVRVFKGGEPFITGNAQDDPRVIAHYAKLWKIHSLMVIPLKVEDRSMGVMRIGSRHRDYFTRDHLELVAVIAREAAVIVETAMLNRRLSETAEQLTTLNRMKDDFVSTVSHEFKTPLTTIMGFMTVILEGETGRLTEQQVKFLTIAMGAAKRLSILVSDLLDISRLEGGVQMDMRAHSFDKILAANMENYKQQAQSAGKALACEAAPALPAVICDERWVGLALDNLVSNALKFSRAGGRVDLSVADKGEFLMVCVADDGIGIPPDDKERIFEKFYRATNRHEINAPGTGLGLAIAKEVISKHGGKIWFESELGRGSKFFFILRAVPRGEPAAS